MPSDVRKPHLRDLKIQISLVEAPNTPVLRCIRGMVHPPNIFFLVELPAVSLLPIG
jgi:hypothetical protein